MSRAGARVVVAAALLCAVAAPASAQRLERRFAERPEPAAPSLLPSIRPLTVAKWSAAALAVGAAVYGFVQQDRADSRYSELEALCATDRTRCRDLTASGAYADPELETRYRSILGEYHTGRNLLIGSQVALAGAIVLFVLDMRDDDATKNVPYDPSRLRLGVREDGAVVAGFRYPVSNITTRSP